MSDDKKSRTEAQRLRCIATLLFLIEIQGNLYVFSALRTHQFIYYVSVVKRTEILYFNLSNPYRSYAYFYWLINVL